MGKQYKVTITIHPPKFQLISKRNRADNDRVENLVGYEYFRAQRLLKEKKG